jgi:hypothetical protein
MRIDAGEMTIEEPTASLFKVEPLVSLFHKKRSQRQVLQLVVLVTLDQNNTKPDITEVQRVKYFVFSSLDIERNKIKIGKLANFVSHDSAEWRAPDRHSFAFRQLR